MVFLREDRCYLNPGEKRLGTAQQWRFDLIVAVAIQLTGDLFQPVSEKRRPLFY